MSIGCSTIELLIAIGCRWNELSASFLWVAAQSESKQKADVIGVSIMIVQCFQVQRILAMWWMNGQMLAEWIEMDFRRLVPAHPLSGFNLQLFPINANKPGLTSWLVSF